MVVNLQGDEPLMPPALVRRAAQLLAGDRAADIATLCHPLRSLEEWLDPNVVKLAMDTRGRALYFSRSPIPYYRSGTGGPHYKHIGLYGYRKSFLLRYASLEPTPLEKAEALEQLRALEHGYAIQVAVTEHDAVSVDTPEDLDRVRRLFGGAP